MLIEVTGTDTSTNKSNLNSTWGYMYRCLKNSETDCNRHDRVLLVQFGY